MLVFVWRVRCDSQWRNNVSEEIHGVLIANRSSLAAAVLLAGVVDHLAEEMRLRNESRPSVCFGEPKALVTSRYLPQRELHDES